MTWETLSAACTVTVKDDCVLLARQRRSATTFWELPGGYVDPGETFEQAAARETIEETGIAVTVGALVCTLTWERQKTRRRNIVAYLAATPTEPVGELRPQVEEGIDAVEFAAFSSIAPESIHPMERPILERWPELGYHLHFDVVEGDGGGAVYQLRRAEGGTRQLRS